MAFGSAGMSALVKLKRRAQDKGQTKMMIETRRKVLVQQRINSMKMDTWPPLYRKLVVTCIKLISHHHFVNLITGAIVIAGILAGISTYPATETGAGADVINGFDTAILYLFAFEVIVKIISRGTSPWVYFHDHWNKFDFSIVLLSFLPLNFDFTVLRTLRLLRVLRLLNAMTKLRILVQSLFASLKAILYVCMLLLLVFYIYSVTGVFLFKDNDPFHFRSLEVSFLSMYRAATFEDWTDIMYINMYGCANYGYSTTANLTNLDGSPAPWFLNCTDSQGLGLAAVFFFCSFSLFTTMILFNLFIGVILTNIEKSQEEILSEIRLEYSKVQSQMFFMAHHRLHVAETPGAVAKHRWAGLRQQIVSQQWRYCFKEEIKAIETADATERLTQCLVPSNETEMHAMLTLLDEELSMTWDVLEDIARLNPALHRRSSAGGQQQRDLGDARQGHRNPDTQLPKKQADMRFDASNRSHVM